MKTDNKTVTLTPKNVEEVVFFDTELRKLLPEFSELFQTWQLGTIIPGLRPTAQKAILDFLEQLTKNNIDTIKNYLNCEVFVEKLDHCIIRDYSISINEAEGMLNSDTEKYEQFFVYRKDGQLYICFWR